MWELVLMKPYLFSLGAGILVGIVYSLINVRSPAPPVIALVGLLGILAGEQVVPLAKRLLSDQPVTTGWVNPSRKRRRSAKRQCVAAWKTSARGVTEDRADLSITIVLKRNCNAHFHAC